MCVGMGLVGRMVVSAAGPSASLTAPPSLSCKASPGSQRELSGPTQTEGGCSRLFLLDSLAQRPIRRLLECLPNPTH